MCGYIMQILENIRDLGRLSTK